MKKFGKLFLALFISIFCSISVVNAASKCSYDEQAKLNNAVANIKVSYEEAEEVMNIVLDSIDNLELEEDDIIDSSNSYLQNCRKYIQSHPHYK